MKYKYLSRQVSYIFTLMRRVHFKTELSMIDLNRQKLQLARASEQETRSIMQKTIEAAKISG